jgi:hypothetical protein
MEGVKGKMVFFVSVAVGGSSTNGSTNIFSSIEVSRQKITDMCSLCKKTLLLLLR